MYQAAEFVVIGEDLPTGDGRRASIKVVGEVDLEEADEMERILVEALDSGASEVAVDLSGVSFMGSAGLTALIKAHRRAGEVGGQLVVRNPSAIVRRVIDITAVDQALTVEADAEA